MSAPAAPPSSMPPAMTRPPAAAASAPPASEEEAKLVAQVISLKKIPFLRVTPDALTKLPLDHRAGFVLTMIDGASSIDDLIDASGMSRLDVLRIVVSLIGKGVVGVK
jgi:hypothetical protein